MNHLNSLIVVALGMAPALAAADTVTFRCHAPHYVRYTGPVTGGAPLPPAELRLTVITFSNADLEHSAVIERMTWRDADGVVRHDSGPKIGVPHPLTLGRDITKVPPGGAFNTSTTSLGSPPWFLSHPSFAVGLPPLESLFVTNGTLTVEIFTRGNPRLVMVHARETSRGLTPDQLGMTDERSSQSTKCFRIRDRDD